MAENVMGVPKVPNKPRRALDPLAKVPMWLFQAIVIAAVAIAAGASTYSVYQEAVADAEEDRQELIDEGDPEGAAEVEVDFDPEDAYRFYAWIIIFAVMTEVAYFGARQSMPFASVVQIGLIVLLTVSFALITQQVERDVYRVGVFSLIIFTLVQVAFGNIPPQTNIRNSMIGLLITAVVIAAVVGFSIWLAPTLIRLGQ
jgi:amino acid transporter